MEIMYNVHPFYSGLHIKLWSVDVIMATVKLPQLNVPGTKRPITEFLGLD